VKLQPSNVQAWHALAVNAEQRSDWSSLENIANEMKQAEPSAMDGYLYHATARMNQGDASGAEADLKYLVLRAPQNPVPFVKLGQLRFAQKRWGDAESSFQSALSKDPNFLDAVRGLVAVSLAKNQPQEAENFIAQRISANPNSTGLYMMQGDLFLRLKQPQQAEEAFRHAMKVDPNNPAPYMRLAETHAAEGELQLAVDEYNRAIQLAPQDVGLYVELGTVYEKLGNWQSARDTYQKGLTIQPDHALAANNLAYVLLEHGGDPNVALRLAQTARRGLPTLPNSADTLGWAYYNTGAYSAAAPLFETAVSGKPNDPTYHLHLGLAYQKLQDKTRAKAEFEKVMSLDAKSPAAEQARQAMSQLSAS
jgi:tetratricopeptide (TPR) repeat protein